MTPRTLEIWDDMGVAREAIDAGLWLAGLRLMIADAPARDVDSAIPDVPYGTLGLPQPAEMTGKSIIALAG